MSRSTLRPTGRSVAACSASPRSRSRSNAAVFFDYVFTQTREGDATSPKGAGTGRRREATSERCRLSGSLRD